MKRIPPLGMVESKALLKSVRRADKNHEEFFSLRKQFPLEHIHGSGRMAYTGPIGRI
jgi:hypothetical protein